MSGQFQRFSSDFIRFACFVVSVPFGALGFAVVRQDVIYNRIPGVMDAINSSSSAEAPTAKRHSRAREMAMIADTASVRYAARGSRA